MAGGAVSQARAFLIGLNQNDDPLFQQTLSTVEQNICNALYQRETVGKGIVPIAFFTDYNCPYCRVLTRKLAILEDKPNSGIRVFWHELPILGNTSVQAAKGALAAKRQGAYRQFHQRLMRSRFVATESYLMALASQLDIDGPQLIADMQSPEIEQEIRTGKALAKLFGIVGTPALIVGRTLVMGELDEPTLERLIERERAEGPLKAC